MMHSTLHVRMHHAIFLQDTAYFAHQDSPYNTPTSYILLCALSRLPVSQSYANVC